LVSKQIENKNSQEKTLHISSVLAYTFDSRTEATKIPLKAIEKIHFFITNFSNAPFLCEKTFFMYQPTNEFSLNTFI